ncbi:MAG: ATP-binding protein [Thermodesulfovibrionales bacterium]|jgi:anti-sigma regulatory factor (Ser/Thr protein kinase)
MERSGPAEGIFPLIGGDFTHAGTASSELKSLLSRLGVSQELARRAAIAAFEAEMNVIIHAAAGMMHYVVTAEDVRVTVTDMGPGIENIDLAMTEGYSTAPPRVREMGWGAGMGLPNIRRNADLLRVDSVVGEGTTLEIIIYTKGKAATSGQLPAAKEEHDKS